MGRFWLTNNYTTKSDRCQHIFAVGHDNFVSIVAVISRNSTFTAYTSRFSVRLCAEIVTNITS